jgi:hypothetical protein
MTAIGLAIGELFLDDLAQKGKEPSTDKDRDFWHIVEPHVLQARNTNWEYYSVFRNLFILLIPAAVLWAWSMCQASNGLWALVVIIVAIPIEYALFRAMRILMKVECAICQEVSAAPDAD